MTELYCLNCKKKTKFASSVGACSICGWDGSKGFDKVKNLHDEYYGN